MANRQRAENIDEEKQKYLLNKLKNFVKRPVYITLELMVYTSYIICMYITFKPNIITNACLSNFKNFPSPPFYCAPPPPIL